ncbi:hypothetical protein OG497_37955 [Streptomyces sp. NBC_01242]|uniref:hypothetical protein n=1 Tax=Streptomyces sp. NBC_01242 TaxID=2903795 RepID=UPI00224D88C3|nr:hypothetical protein [Streptomyces sp. NBC_01242]MCX4799644.1 hypothetical protein [Streptomyces sp. NBC_01242]
MDPVDLEQLLYELRSVNAETITIPSKSLTPGCVIASQSPWSQHVVTKLPAPVSATRVRVTVRHLHGGHNASFNLMADGKIEIYRHRLASAQLSLVPTVPHCIVPDDPEPGDRVVHAYHDKYRLGEGRFFEFNGTEWQQVRDTVDRGRCSTVVRTFSLGIRCIVSNPAEPSPLGWYTYLPAKHRPFLYVDGAPMPARTVDDLTVGDTIRITGGGRLLVTDIRQHSTSTTLVMTLTQKPTHHMRQFLWDRSEGAVIEHHDSGRTRTLYPTDPRPGELLGAVGLTPGDTVIAAWGLPYSAVMTVEDVWGQPLLNHMNVHGTASDGRPVRILTGQEKRYYLLHRPAAVHARAVYEPLARAHA